MGSRGKSSRTKFRVVCKYCGWKGKRVTYNYKGACPHCKRRGGVEEVAGQRLSEYILSKALKQ